MLNVQTKACPASKLKGASPMKNISILSIDLAKNVFQLHGQNKQGKQVLKKRLRREELRNTIANLPPCLVAMETCIGAHAWARQFMKMGHQVKLLAPQYVKPFVRVNKNDQRDAAAIALAASLPSIPIRLVKKFCSGRNSNMCSFKIGLTVRYSKNTKPNCESMGNTI